MAAPTPESATIVDASWPFRSVKEAVAIFGERILPRETHPSPKHPSVSFEKQIIHTASQKTGRVSLETKKIPELQPPSVGSAYVESGNKKIPSQKQPNEGDADVESGNIKKIPPPQQQFPNVGTAYVEFEGEIKKIPHSSEITPSSPSKSPDMYTNSYLTPHSPHEITQSPSESPRVVGKEVVKSSSFTNEATPTLTTPQTLDPMNPSHGNVVHGNDLVMMLMVLKKLEAEVQDTKMELRLLKERESETEVALAKLNTELHKNMSKMANAEAAEARKTANSEKPRALLQGVRRSWEIASTKEEDPEEEERSGMPRRSSDMIVKNMDSPTLAKILSMTNYDGYFREGTKSKSKALKKKPIIPLVTDICPWRKRSSSSSSPHHDLSGSLFSSHLYF